MSATNSAKDTAFARLSGAISVERVEPSLLQAGWF
jgi:hypothetical protein